MKRIAAFLLVILLVFSASIALAETATQKSYKVSTGEYICSGLYTGEIKNGKPHGYGLFTAENGSGVSWHYIGYWENGVMSGEGGKYWDDGSLEIGTFKNGVMVSGTTKDGNGKVTPVLPPTSSVTQSSANKQSQTYIGNKSSKKFHYPSCSSVGDMKEKNKITLNSRDEAVKKGYAPCKRCDP